jgi:two-component system cell cycle sensor histidine kinase/response regulator CckA
MTNTYLLLLWLQVITGLGLSFVLGGLYFSLYREEFLKYWALAHGYGAASLGLVLVAVSGTAATVAQAHAMQVLSVPQYLLLAAAALSVAHPRFGRKQILLLTGLAAAGVVAQFVTGVIFPDLEQLRLALRSERHVMGALTTGWFCVALWRKYPFATTAAGRITLSFAAMESLHNLAVASTVAGIPPYSGPYSLLAGVLAACLPVGMAAGAFLLILRTSADSHRALRESEDRYRSLVTTSPDAFTMSTLDGTMALCNQRAAELFGYGSAEKLIGNACRSLIAPSDKQTMEGYLSELLNGGVIRARLLRFRRRDGSEFQGEVSATLTRGGDGKPTGWMALTRDISQRVRDEERLRLLAQALQGAGDCINITDPEDVILYVNDAFLRTYEYEESEIVGQHITLLRPREIPNNALGDPPPLPLMDGWRGEFWNCSKSGRVFPISLATSVVHDDTGRPIAAIGVARDITERKQAEEARAKLEEQLRQAQKMESIGRLAGGVAHDFNNILTVINGYSDLAMRRLRPEGTMLTYLKQIRRSGEQAAALTQQLLAFSRKQIIQPSLLDMRVTIIGSADMLRRLVGEDVEVATYADEHLGMVMADPVQIEQVVMNLAINARDAMPDGGQLTIRLSNHDLEEGSEEEVPPGPYVLLSIADTGMGFDEETRAHLFEPFFTTKEKGKGTGLGLSTVYGIVQQSQGWIRVHSELGKGSTFNIYLPRMSGEVEQPEVLKAAPAAAGGNETLLLVEDQDDLRVMAKSVLEEQGYRILEAANGEDALQLIHNFSDPIDLLVTDVVLPGINGRQLAEQFAGMRSGAKVLYTSGYSDDVIADRGVLDPGVAYIPKPYTPEGLAERVREVLGPRGRPRTILVVDDEAAIREMLNDALSNAGYRVIVAANGRQAVESVAAACPDLMITDMVMPDQEGVETIQMIRKKYPRVKIVAMSGALGGSFLRALGRLGADAHLVKPIDAGELETVVSSLLSE